MPRLTIISVALLLVAGAWIAASGDWRSIGGNVSGKPGDGVASAATTRDGGRRDAAQQKVSVEAATATATSSSTDLRAIGSLQSDESVQITSEIAGRVTELPVQRGRHRSRRATCSSSSTTRWRRPRSPTPRRATISPQANIDRAKQLSRTGNVTEKAIDEATANFEMARAALELAKVRLSKHTITAPFSGVRRHPQGLARRLRRHRHADRQPREDRHRSRSTSSCRSCSCSSGQGRPDGRRRGRRAAGRDVSRRDLRHRSAGRRERPRARDAGPAAQCGPRAAAGPVRAHRRQGQADARGACWCRKAPSCRAAAKRSSSASRTARRSRPR